MGQVAIPLMIQAVGLGLQGYSQISAGKAKEAQANAEYAAGVEARGSQLAYQTAAGEAQATAVEQSAAAEAEGYNQNADAQQRAAEIAKANANEISATFANSLTDTIANIRAVRASTYASADSPSSRAYIDKQVLQSDQARGIKVGSARLQGAQAASDAIFYRTAATRALLRGKTSAASLRYASNIGASTDGLVAPNGAYAKAGIISSLPYFFNAATVKYQPKGA